MVRKAAKRPRRVVTDIESRNAKALDALSRWSSKKGESGCSTLDAMHALTRLDHAALEKKIGELEKELRDITLGYQANLAALRLLSKAAYAIENPVEMTQIQPYTEEELLPGKREAAAERQQAPAKRRRFTPFKRPESPAATGNGVVEKVEIEPVVRKRSEKPADGVDPVDGNLNRGRIKVYIEAAGPTKTKVLASALNLPAHVISRLCNHPLFKRNLGTDEWSLAFAST